jgi:flagellar M-ring protein FliF
VAVITRSFEQLPDGKQAFYEAPWFATVVRNGVALIAVLLVLLLGVRPLIKALRGKEGGGKAEGAGGNANARGAADGEAGAALPAPLAAEEMMDPDTGVVDAELLSQQVGLAQRIAQERPEDAVVALRQMLNQPATEPEAAQ